MNKNIESAIVLKLKFLNFYIINFIIDLYSHLTYSKNITIYIKIKLKKILVI